MFERDLDFASGIRDNYQRRSVAEFLRDRIRERSELSVVEGLQLANRLEQKRVARECAQWISEKAEIRSVSQACLLHGKMYRISRNGIEEAILTLRSLRA